MNFIFQGYDVTSPDGQFPTPLRKKDFHLQVSVCTRIMPAEGRERKSTAIMTVFIKRFDWQPKLGQWLLLATPGIRNKDM
jgi:hypothetical protein